MAGEENKVRLLLVDDHPVVREGLRAVLSTRPRLSVVGEASSGEEALGMSRRFIPHLVLTDVRMPGMDGIELTRQIKAILPATAIIVLTMHEDEAYLLDALRAGASGYLMKDSPQASLCQAIDTVLGGGTVIGSGLLQRALQATMLHAVRESPGKSSCSAPPKPLRDRELKILEMVSQGLVNKEMAKELHLAEVTIKKQLQGIFAKLGASDRTQAATIAVRMGLVE